MLGIGALADHHAAAGQQRADHPGQQRVKLCAIGKPVRYTVCSSKPQTSALARTL